MNSEQKLSFQTVEDPNTLIPILKARHPQSCFFYNQVVSFDRFKREHTFFSLGTEINFETWLVVRYIRKDSVQSISISAPTSVVEGKEQIPLHVKESFSSGGTAINWDESLLFCALEKRVSSMIFDINVNVKGKITNVHPCILYCMEIEDSLNLDICSRPDAEVRRLCSDNAQDCKFFETTWKYYDEVGSGGELEKWLIGNASAGVFVDGKCVSGVLCPGYGIISALYTLGEYRNRGFAKLTMKYAFKEFAKDGCVPCLTVELRNEKSIAFQQSLGLQAVSVVDWIDTPKWFLD